MSDTLQIDNSAASVTFSCYGLLDGNLSVAQLSNQTVKYKSS